MTKKRRAILTKMAHDCGADVDNDLYGPLPFTPIPGGALSYNRYEEPDDMSNKTDDGVIRTFEGGATRDTSENKLDYEAILNPRVLHEYVKYMNKHRVQSDGSIREGDNWQKGMPPEVFMKSHTRHFFDVWLLHRGYQAEATTEDQLEALYAEMFNVMGSIFMLLKHRDDKDKKPAKITITKDGKAFAMDGPLTEAEVAALAEGHSPSMVDPTALEKVVPLPIIIYKCTLSMREHIDRCRTQEPDPGTCGYCDYLCTENPYV